MTKELLLLFYQKNDSEEYEYSRLQFNWQVSVW